MKLYFIRHAESIKSQENRHGGEGLPLTEQGRQDAFFVSSWLKSKNISGLSIYCSTLIQVVETAEIISTSLGSPLIKNDILKNINIGVLQGLTETEGYEKHYDAANQLQLWREGKLSINAVNIPGSEKPQDFYTRIYSFITELLQRSNSVVIVGTRSVGVALTNILLTRQPLINEKEYKRYLFDPSSVTCFDIQGLSTKILLSNYTGFLPSTPDFPDI